MKNFTQKSLIIFDWDGTLMDSIGLIVEAMRVSAQKNGLTVTDDATKGIIGIALAEAIALLFPNHPEKHEAILASYAEFYTQHSDKDKLFDGIKNLLVSLQAQGKILAIATGKKRQGLQRVLPNSGIEPLFAITKTADETAGKPNPLMLEQILAETGKSIDDAVLIGDSVHDIRMANALVYQGQKGMDSIAVSYGCETAEILAKENPTAVVGSVAELDGLLSNVKKFSAIHYKNIPLEAENIFQLIGLHRILHKSKFDERLDDCYTKFGSEWSNTVLDTIIEFYQHNGELEEVKTWKNWRLLTKNRLEYRVILNKLLATQDYLKERDIILTHEQKVFDILMMSSPFVLSDELMDEFLQELTHPYP